MFIVLAAQTKMLRKRKKKDEIKEKTKSNNKIVIEEKKKQKIILTQSVRLTIFLYNQSSFFHSFSFHIFPVFVQQSAFKSVIYGNLEKNIWINKFYFFNYFFLSFFFFIIEFSFEKFFFLKDIGKTMPKKRHSASVILHS